MTDIDPETRFVPLSTLQSWHGFGINTTIDTTAPLSNQIHGTMRLSTYWAKIYLELADPGKDAIYFDDDMLDQIWETSNCIQNKLTLFTYSSFEFAKPHFIFTMRSAPQSWLTTDGANELRGDALQAYARLFASAIIVHHKHKMPVSWVELIDDPSTNQGSFITPENYVVLIQTFREILRQRISSIDSIYIRIMAPGISVMHRHQTVEPYIAIFTQEPVIDAWSIQVLEPEIDTVDYNVGTFDARHYIRNQLHRMVQMMRLIRSDIPIYATKFATNATRFSHGIDYGKGAPETIEYTFRLLDNVCGILNNGVSAALCWFLNRRNDKKSLYRNDGSKRPQRDALSLLNKIIPETGQVYIPDNPTHGNPQDQTIKACVVSGNAFGFILCRAHSADASVGHLSLSVDNPNWDVSTTLKCTMSLHVFPNHISIDAVTRNIQITNGILKIELNKLPYQCIIFGKGDVYKMP
jgi:hypothetical protein